MGRSSRLSVESKLVVSNGDSLLEVFQVNGSIGGGNLLDHVSFKSHRAGEDRDSVSRASSDQIAGNKTVGSGCLVRTRDFSVNDAISVGSM